MRHGRGQGKGTEGIQLVAGGDGQAEVTTEEEGSLLAWLPDACLNSWRKCRRDGHGFSEGLGLGQMSNRWCV